MFFSRLLLAGCLLFLILGCHSNNSGEETTAQSPSKQTITDLQFDTVATDRVFVYQCDNSLQAISYSYANTDSTRLFLPDTALAMSRLKSASGVRYEAGNYLYWTKGDEALLQLPKGSLMSCQLKQKQKSWAAAKLRGVDFRAVGQEPGWILEITKDKQIKYVGNYGQDTVYTPVPNPTKESDKSVYNAQTEDHHLIITIEDKSCRDAMNGAQFPQTVYIQVDNKKYKGCGEKLTN